jgi:hypothetical protein
MSRYIDTLRGRKLPKIDTTIYVIGAAKGLKTIGLAYNPAARFKAIQTEHGAALSILHARRVRGDLASDVGHRAHWLLRERRVHVMAGFIRKAVDAAIDAAELEKRKPLKGAAEG